MTSDCSTAINSCDSGHRMDKKLLDENFRKIFISTGDSGNDSESASPNNPHPLTQQIPESASSDSRIDPCIGNVHQEAIDDNEDVKKREIRKRRKRKNEEVAKPTIICDEFVNVPLPKKLKRSNFVKNPSPDPETRKCNNKRSIQKHYQRITPPMQDSEDSDSGDNDSDTKSDATPRHVLNELPEGKSRTLRYNTRKKYENQDKVIYHSGDSESGSEASISQENLKDETELERKQRLLADFDESGDDDQDKEYNPKDDEGSEQEDDENWETDQEDLEMDLTDEKKFSESLNITLGDIAHSSAPDDRELTVDLTTSRSKKHFCFYCKKFQVKLARHLQSKHPNEEDVKKFSVLPPKNKERQEIIATIRKNGDYLFNTDRKYNNGTLIVCRRPSAKKTKNAEDFIACGNCKGQYSRAVIRHHWRRCTRRDGKHERIIRVKGKKISARVHERASADVRKYIFPYLREDEIARVIRYDELLIIFANKQCEKYGTHEHLYQMIRARLRLLGRFLTAIKVINAGISNFTDVFQPRNYDSMIIAVRNVAGFLPETKTFAHPAVGSNLGTLLKQVGDAIRSEYIKRELPDKQKQVDDFLKLLEEDYGTSINRVVTETQTQHHRRKQVVLPSTEDIKKLYTYITTQRNEHLTEVKMQFSFDTWKKLAETTLLSLLVFNRRRPGEMERLYVEDCLSYRGINEMADKEIYDSLNPEGQALAREYVRFEIRGKRNRSVPVLVDSDTLEAIKKILEHREDAGVPQSNNYLFGLPSNDKDRPKYHRACNLMRAYSTKCGAEIPHLLRGTELRKHIATRCINLNLQGSQVTDLANFMGHHENIHKQIYRQPVAATDIVKISKILHMVQGVDEADGSSDDDVETGGTPSRRSVDEPSTSQNDSDYGSLNSTSSPRNQRSQKSGKSDCSTPKRGWSDEARSTVLQAFGKQLENGKMPSGKEMQHLIDHNDCLKGRSVPQMRTWLHIYKNKATH